MIRSALMVVFSALCFATPPAPDTLESLRQRADHGDAQAQFELGSKYERGSGVARDYAEALRWYRKAAEQGDVRAQSSLGFMYQDGTGVAWDYDEARRWYCKAVAQGDAAAWCGLGSIPPHLNRDDEEELRWCLKAAEQGEVHAQYRLGSMYDHAAGDQAQAVLWYRKAAEQGHAQAQFILAGKYFEGAGVARDFAEAARLYGCPKPSEDILASCKEITYEDLPEGAKALLQRMDYDVPPDSAYNSGSAFDLNGDGSPEYQICRHEAPHGPCGSVLVGKVGSEWKDLTARPGRGGLLGFSGACNLVIVLESQQAGFHDICLPTACAPGTGSKGTPCRALIWQYDGSTYRVIDTTVPKASSR